MLQETGGSEDECGSAVQGVWGQQHLPAWAAAQRVQGVWRQERLPARANVQDVQGVWTQWHL